MTQPSLFGKHKYDTKEQQQSEVAFLVVILMFVGLFSFLYLFSWNAANIKEMCSNIGGEMLVVKDGGRYDSTQCIKDGKILRLF